jgi:hypothetical protein
VSNLEFEFSKLEHRYDKEFSFDKKYVLELLLPFSIMIRENKNPLS